LNSHTLFIIKYSKRSLSETVFAIPEIKVLSPDNVNDLCFSACFLHRTRAHVKQTIDKRAIHLDFEKNQISVNVYIGYVTVLYSSQLAGEPQDFERLSHENQFGSSSLFPDNTLHVQEG